MFIGIDPGVNGAIGVVDIDGKFIEVIDMPIELRGKKKQVCPAELARFLAYYTMDSHVEILAIEQVGAMPKQGVTSSFNFGMSYGIARGVASLLGCPVRLFRPQLWKKHHSLLGCAKDESRTRALDIFGQLPELRRKKDADRAEALLIALYARSIA